MPDTPFSAFSPKNLKHGWPFPEKKPHWDVEAQDVEVTQELEKAPSKPSRKRKT